MFLSYTTWGMPQVPIDVAIRHCAALGYDGLELTISPGRVTDAAGLSAAERKSIRQLYDDAGLVLCGIAGHAPPLPPNPDDALANRERFRGYLDIAAEWQRPGQRLSVVTMPGGKDGTWEEVKGTLVERFGVLAELADERRVIVAVEPHVGMAVDRPEQAVWLAEQVNSPAFRVHFDISHFNIQGDDMDEVIALLTPYAVHSHVKDERGRWPNHEFLIPGEGECDYVRYLKGMERAGYAGHIVPEISVMVQQRPNYDPLAAATQSYEVLSRAFAEAGVRRGG